MKYYLLAESGSTKTDWVQFDEKGAVLRIRTSGINPDIQSDQAIIDSIERELIPGITGKDIAHVWFYGAGMANHNNRDLVSDILQKFLSKAKIEVEHDLFAAARAACMNEDGITCILGTGSNSCLFDGKEIVKEIGGHGYIFGDEGSGADIGKSLMRSILNGDSSPEMIRQFEAWTGMKKLDVRKSVYQAERPNVYLAGLSKFIANHSADYPELNSIVFTCFLNFLDATVCQYEDYRKLPVHFIGSIAYVYEELLVHACNEKGIESGKIVRSPIGELLQYHMKELGIPFTELPELRSL